MIVKFIVSCMIRKIERILNPKYIIRRTVLFYLIRLKSLGTIEYIEEKCGRRKCLVNRSSSPFLFNLLYLQTFHHFSSCILPQFPQIIFPKRNHFFLLQLPHTNHLCNIMKTTNDANSPNHLFKFKSFHPKFKFHFTSNSPNDVSLVIKTTNDTDK